MHVSGDQIIQVIQVAHLVTWVFLVIQSQFNFSLAPEVMCRQNHGVAVDYFALGIMAYEFMMGRVKLKILSP